MKTFKYIFPVALAISLTSMPVKGGENYLEEIVKRKEKAAKELNVPSEFITQTFNGYMTTRSIENQLITLTGILTQDITVSKKSTKNHTTYTLKGNFSVLNNLELFKYMLRSADYDNDKIISYKELKKIQKDILDNY